MLHVEAYSVGGIKVENANDIVNILLTNGGTVVMAVLFIIFLFYDRRDRKEKETQDKEERKLEREANNKILNELSASNRNVAESLNLLKTSIDTNNIEFRQHDERAIKNFEHIKEDLIILKERGEK